MKTIAPHQQNAFVLSLDYTLKSQIKASLAKPLKEMADKMISDVVDQVIEDLNLSLESYKDREYMRDVVNILVRRVNLAP